MVGLSLKKNGCTQHWVAARLAGHWSNGHFIAVVLHLGWTNIAGLLFVNLYFYIFNQQRFRADEQWIPALQQALLVVGKAKEEHHLSKKQRSSSFRFIKFFVRQIPLLLAAIKTDSVFSLRFCLDGVAFFYFQFRTAWTKWVAFVFLKSARFVLLGFGIGYNAHFLKALRPYLISVLIKSYRLYRLLFFTINFFGWRWGSFHLAFSF